MVGKTASAGNQWEDKMNRCLSRMCVRCLVIDTYSGPMGVQHALFFANLRKATISVVIPVCSSVWNNSAPPPPPAGRIFMKFGIWIFFENMPSRFEFYSSITRIPRILHEDLCRFMIINCWIVLKMRNVSDKRCWENQNTISYWTFFFLKIFLFIW